MAVKFEPIEPATASAAIEAAWRELADVEEVVAVAEGREGRLATSQAAADDVLIERYHIGRRA